MDGSLPPPNFTKIGKDGLAQLFDPTRPGSNAVISAIAGATHSIHRRVRASASARILSTWAGVLSTKPPH